MPLKNLYNGRVNSKHPADGEELLIKAANSVNAFAELQRFFEKIDGKNLWARTKTYFKLNRRPVAIVTEPNPDWNWFEDPLLHGMVIKWGRLRGFCVRYPTDFPSWSLNTNTPLIEITRARD